MSLTLHPSLAKQITTRENVCQIGASSKPSSKVPKPLLLPIGWEPKLFYAPSKDPYVTPCPRRKALPGSAPVFSPWSMTTCPLTMT